MTDVGSTGAPTANGPAGLHGSPYRGWHSPGGRRILSWLQGGVALLGLFLLGGCGAPITDYRAFLDHMPKSILVLPPLNESAHVEASDAFLSTVTFPLAEAGYYVFPVAVVDQMMKENGLPTPGEMHQVSPQKLEEVFGADAVLYITIQDWQQQYVIISSRTTVTMVYRLVDLKSGAQLWGYQQTVASGRGGLSVQGMVEAAAHALVSAATDEGRKLAAQANHVAFENSGHGLLKGSRHPDYEIDQERRRAQQEKLDKAAGSSG